MRTAPFAAAFCALVSASITAGATEYTVATSADLLDKLQNAAPGDVIKVAPGTYAFDDKIRLNKTGTPDKPIVLRGDGDIGTVIFQTPGPEGFYIPGTDYVVEKIWLQCQGGGCNGAAGFSIKETARRITISQCRTTDFYQHYKGSMVSGAGAEDVTIQNSEAYNTASYAGNSNVVNLDGGKRWRVIGNYVHDYGNQAISYGIFFKGGTSESVMEKNIVACSHDRPSTGDSVLGISFGGGRMGVQYCAPDNVGSGGCRCEDTGGIARNNIVVGCNDSALHVNSACGSKFLHNLVDSPSTSLQIQSFEGTGAIVVKNNVFSGNVPSSNVDASDNLTGISAAALAQYYKDPTSLDWSDGPKASELGGAPALADVTDDYCGKARGTAPSRGPIEMPAACATWPWKGAATPGTTGSGGGASGSSSSSSGAGTTTSSSGGVGGGDGNGESDSKGGCAWAASTPSNAWGGAVALALAAALARRRSRGAVASHGR